MFLFLIKLVIYVFKKIRLFINVLKTFTSKCFESLCANFWQFTCRPQYKWFIIIGDKSNVKGGGRGAMQKLNVFENICDVMLCISISLSVYLFFSIYIFLPLSFFLSLSVSLSVTLSFSVWWIECIVTNKEMQSSDV